MVLSEVKVAGGGEGDWAGRAGYGTVDGPAMEGPWLSGTFICCCPSASKP